MSSSRSSSTTAQSTEVFNQQVGASEGATAIGAGANVQTNIQTLDAQLGETAIREVGDVSTEATQAVRDTAQASISQTGATARDALDFGDTSLARVFDFATTQQEQQTGREQNFLNFARQQGELVAAGAGVTSPAQVTETIDKFAKLLGIAAATVVIIAFIMRQKKGS